MPVSATNTTRMDQGGRNLGDKIGSGRIAEIMLF